MSDSDTETGNAEFIRCFDQILEIFSNFSDTQNSHLDLEYVFQRVRNFGILNAKPIITRLKRNKKCIIQTIETPTFEKLWESCWYLESLVDTGRNRNADQKIEDDSVDCDKQNVVEKIHQHSVKAFSEYLSSYILDLPSYWLTWCNNVLVGYLQKLVPYSLPPLIWRKIISYLTPDIDLMSCEIVVENFKIGTLSKTVKLQILEKSLLQECILLCSELVKMFGLLLYSPLTYEDVKYLSASISKTAQLFTFTMMRLDALVHLSEEPKCLNMCLKDEFCCTIFDFVGALNSGSQDTMFFIMSFICANDEFENFSPYFVWLEKGSRSEKVFRLIYVKKDTLSSIEPKEITKTKSTENIIDIYSKKRPAIYCSGSIVGVVTTEETKNGEVRWFLWVWDLEISPKDELFKYKLDRLTAVYNKRGMATEGISTVGEVRMSKIGSQINIVATIRFKLASGGKSVCTFVLTFDLQGAASRAGNSSPKPRTMCADSITIGVHKKYVFAIRIGIQVEYMLILQDLEKNLKPLTKVEWDEDNPWEVRFNCNPDRDTCLLYRKNEIQIRKLDDDLTFIRDVTLCFEGCSPLKDPCYQFFDDILYGWRRYDIQESMSENKFANIVKKFKNAEEVTTFFRRGYHAYDEQFFLDLTDENAEPVYFDTIRPMTKYTKPNDPSRVTYKAFLSGFNAKGDLQQMAFTSLRNDCSNDDFGDSGCYSGCQTVNLVTVKFYRTCREFVTDSVPDIDIVLEEHADALARIAKEKEERLKKMLELEQKKAEAESKRKELVAKIATVRALNTKQGKLPLSGRDNLGNLYQRRDRAMKHINNHTRFDCIISRWSLQDCYGFGDIIIDDEIQSVFVHGKSFSGKKVYYNLKKGSLVEFRIEWDLDKPRPKAVETRIPLS